MCRLQPLFTLFKSTFAPPFTPPSPSFIFVGDISKRVDVLISPSQTFLLSPGPGTQFIHRHNLISLTSKPSVLSSNLTPSSMAHFGGRLSLVRTPFANTNMQIEINEPKEGDYLSIKQDGEDWPIVICDEEIIQTFFPRSPRPGSARQADGTWNKDYKAGGFSIDDRHFPAIYLGTLRL